jgi:hypothetical protein
LKKELKQKIKQDEFVSIVEQAAGWFTTHREEARVTAIVLVLLAAGGGALAYFQSHRSSEAEQAFSEALETFRAPVQNEQPEGTEKPPAGALPYATASEKYRKAAAGFDGIDRKYGSLVAARRARYYAALCRIELGETAEAEKALTALAADKDTKSLEPALARVALADLYRRSGQAEKAIEAYRMLAADATLPLPRDHALMNLARTLEEVHRLPEARDSYRRLSEEFPSSVYAGEARQRASYLETAAHHG